MIPHKDILKLACERAYDYFEEIGLEPILLGHTLLFAYRDKDFIEKPNKIIDMACLRENINKSKLDRIKNDGYFSRLSGGVLKYPLIYLTWQLKHDISVELLPLYYADGKRGFNLLNEKYHEWPEEYLLPYGEIEFLGKKYRAPNNIEKWLETYYGPTWNIRDDGFVWGKAPNIRDTLPEGLE